MGIDWIPVCSIMSAFLFARERCVDLVDSIDDFANELGLSDDSFVCNTVVDDNLKFIIYAVLTMGNLVRRIRYDPAFNTLMPIDAQGNPLYIGDYEAGPVAHGTDDTGAIRSLLDYLRFGTRNIAIADDLELSDTEGDDDECPNEA